MEKNESILNKTDKEESCLPRKNFEEVLIKTEVIERNVMSNEDDYVTAEDNEMVTDLNKDHNKIMEFICVKAGSELEYSEEDSEDSMAVSPISEIKVETQLTEGEEEEKEDIEMATNANASQNMQSENVRHKKSMLNQYDKRTRSSISRCNFNSSAGVKSAECTKVHDSLNTEWKQSKNRKSRKCVKTKDTQSENKTCESSQPNTVLKPLTKTKKQYVCSMCNYTTLYLSTIKRHIMSHTGDKPYKCTECDYAVSEMNKLKRHMLVHTGIKQYPYMCSECDYSAPQPSVLKKHMRVHTGERPYKCTLCDYAASTPYRLTEHVRVHTGAKPYKCPTCDYITSQASHLKKHIRVHTGDKPFKCTICDYSASQAGNVKRHFKSAH